MVGRVKIRVLFRFNDHSLILYDIFFLADHLLLFLPKKIKYFKRAPTPIGILMCSRYILVLERNFDRNLWFSAFFLLCCKTFTSSLTCLTFLNRRSGDWQLIRFELVCRAKTNTRANETLANIVKIIFSYLYDARLSFNILFFGTLRFAGIWATLNIFSVNILFSLFLFVASYVIVFPSLLYPWNKKDNFGS